MQRRRFRQCPRCGLQRDRKEKECGSCGARLIRPRFRMTYPRIQRCHVLAKQKGLDEEEYRQWLAHYGVGSCKEFKRVNYTRFVTDLGKLPDVFLPAVKGVE